MMIRFPVGDWSEDGHRECEEFYVETADGVTLERVREAHFGLLENRKIDIGALCHRFEDDTLWAVCSTSPRDEMVGRAQFSVEALHRAEFPIGLTIAKFSPDVEPVPDEDEPSEISYTNMQPHDVFVLWVDLLNWYEPGLGLREVPAATIPGINFYGTDEKGRYLSTPGYGCFRL